MVVGCSCLEVYSLGFQDFAISGLEFMGFYGALGLQGFIKGFRAYLDPKELTLFRAPYYDFLI